MPFPLVLMTTHPLTLNRIPHIVGFSKNTLILDQSGIHHVCCIYLSCNPVFFQMLYKTIQITKRSFNNVLTQTSRYNIVNNIASCVVKINRAPFLSVAIAIKNLPVNIYMHQASNHNHHGKSFVLSCHHQYRCFHL